MIREQMIDEAVRRCVSPWNIKIADDVVSAGVCHEQVIGCILAAFSRIAKEQP